MCCGACCVCVHTLRVARTFCLVALRTLCTLHACAHTHVSRMGKRGMCNAHVVTLTLAFSLLMFHPSAPLPSDNLFRHRASVSHIHGTLARFTKDPKWRVRRTSATVRMTLTTWPTCPTPTGYEPIQPGKVVRADDDSTPINDPDHDSMTSQKTTHENTGWFGVPTEPLFRRFLDVTLLLRKKAKKA